MLNRFGAVNLSGCVNVLLKTEFLEISKTQWAFSAFMFEKSATVH